MQPPLQPKYILRGHSAAVHSVHFLRDNSRLITGDSEGWTVLWDMMSRRPAVVWQPHKATILGLGSWDEDRIITHGRDNKLLVWQLSLQDEAALAHQLPVETPAAERPSPWLLHSLAVNTLNFCSFSSWSDKNCNDTLLVAVPGADESSIVIYSLPSEAIVTKITSAPRTKTGMLMALSLFRKDGKLTLLAAHEIGSVVVWRQDNTSSSWTQVSTTTAHAQPALSICIAPDLSSAFSSGADAVIAKYNLDGSPEIVIKTKHAGQQGLSVRSDGRIFATAGWDGRARIYSTKIMQELAVLKWHKEGCYALAFANVQPGSTTDPEPAEANDSTAVTKAPTSTVAQRRQQAVQSTHWLALGSKDGKVSLWDVF